MSDPYEGVTTPDSERQRLVRSVFHPSPLAEVAEAVSVAIEEHPHIYVERQGDRYRWSFALRACGPYPLLRTTAQFLKIDYGSLGGVGSREVGDGWCVQIVDETDMEPEASVVLRFDEATPTDQVSSRITDVLRSVNRSERTDLI